MRKPLCLFLCRSVRVYRKESDLFAGRSLPPPHPLRLSPSSLNNYCSISSGLALPLAQPLDLKRDGTRTLTGFFYRFRCGQRRRHRKVNISWSVPSLYMESSKTFSDFVSRCTKKIKLRLFFFCPSKIIGTRKIRSIHVKSDFS